MQGGGGMPGGMPNVTPEMAEMFSKMQGGEAETPKSPVIDEMD